MIRVFFPAWYIDDGVADDLGLGPADPWFRVFSRLPEPEETSVRQDQIIRFTLGSNHGDPTDPSLIKVFVSIDGAAEVLAFDGPSHTHFQPGFQGGNSEYASLFSTQGTIVAFEIESETIWPSESLITVRVEATTFGAQVLPDASWTFEVEDRTEPLLVSAAGRGKDVVRVTFNEPMKMTTDSDGALNPANYTITPLEFPAVTLEVVSAAVASPESVDLTLDIEMSQAKLYELAVAAVADATGNVIVPDTRNFIGFVPNIPTGRMFDLFRMLSQKSRDEDPGDLFKFVACLQDVADLLLCGIDEWTDILDVDVAPEPFVDAMLCDLGNPFQFDLTLAEKRRLVRVLLSIYKEKGTKVGIESAIQLFVGVDVEILSFNNEGWTLGEDELGELVLASSEQSVLYSFEVVSPVILTQEQRDQITDIVDLMKPAHTHLIRITEPEIPTVIDHLELGLSELGDTFILH